MPWWAVPARNYHGRKKGRADESHFARSRAIRRSVLASRSWTGKSRRAALIRRLASHSLAVHRLSTHGIVCDQNQRDTYREQAVWRNFLHHRQSESQSHRATEGRVTGSYLEEKSHHVKLDEEAGFRA